MLPIPTLGQDQIDHFTENGFVAVPGAFDDSEIARIGAWADELASRPEESGKHWVYRERSLVDPGKAIINRIENFSRHHAGFVELTQVLKHSAGQLLGEEAVLFKEKINFKMPGGDGFKPHQDSQAGWDAYASAFVNVLVCVDEADEENGCLQVAPGHHRRGIIRAWEPLTVDDMADMDFVLCPTRPGDLVFFDSFIPHGSEPNLTRKMRRLYFATFNRRSDGDHLERYYADKFKSYPPDIDREPDKEYVYRV